MEMDIGVLERDREELKFRGNRKTEENRGGWLRNKKRSENTGQERDERVERERNRENGEIQSCREIAKETQFLPR